MTTMTTDDGTSPVIDVTPTATAVLASTGPLDDLLTLTSTARRRLP